MYSQVSVAEVPVCATVVGQRYGHLRWFLLHGLPMTPVRQEGACGGEVEPRFHTQQEIHDVHVQQTATMVVFIRPGDSSVDRQVTIRQQRRQAAIAP